MENERFFTQSNSDVNDDFINRQKSVFGKLDAVVKEKEVEVTHNILKRKDIVEDEGICKRQRRDTKQFRGQESIFKRPEAQPPPRFNRNIPDYQRHPQKWTKYTLSDVSEDDMSDSSNTAAAMSFLQEIKSKKQSERMELECGETSIKFSKPSSNFKNSRDVSEQHNMSESSTFRSSKVIMPEYVIGDKKPSKKSARQPVDKSKKCLEIRLDHLEEDE